MPEEGTPVVDQAQIDAMADLLSDNPVEPEADTDATDQYMESEGEGEETPTRREPILKDERDKKQEPESEEAEPEPADEEPEEEEEEPEEEPDSEEHDEPDDLEAMRQEYIELARSLSQQGQVQPPKAAPKKEKPAPEPETVETETEEFEFPDNLELGEFLTEEELDRVLDDPKLLNTAMKRALQPVLENTLKALKRLHSDMQMAPQQMASIAQNAVTTQNFVTDFFSQNEDLKQYGDVVRMYASQIANQAITNGEEKTWGDVLTEAGEKTRKALRLPKEKQSPKKRKVSDPALPGAKTGRRVRPKKRQKPTDQQALMEDLLGG